MSENSIPSKELEAVKKKAKKIKDFDKKVDLFVDLGLKYFKDPDDAEKWGMDQAEKMKESNKMEKYVQRFVENVNDDIDFLISMIMSKKFDSEVYARGLSGLKDKYNAIEDKNWKGFRAMLISYKRNPNKRNLLSKEIIREFEFLTG